MKSRDVPTKNVIQIAKFIIDVQRLEVKVHDFGNVREIYACKHLIYTNALPNIAKQNEDVTEDLDNDGYQRDYSSV